MRRSRLRSSPSFEARQLSCGDRFPARARVHTSAAATDDIDQMIRSAQTCAVRNAEQHLIPLPLSADPPWYEDLNALCRKNTGEGASAKQRKVITEKKSQSAVTTVLKYPVFFSFCLVVWYVVPYPLSIWLLVAGGYSRKWTVSLSRRWASANA